MSNSNGVDTIDETLGAPQVGTISNNELNKSSVGTINNGVNPPQVGTISDNGLNTNPVKTIGNELNTNPVKTIGNELNKSSVKTIDNGLKTNPVKTIDNGVKTNPVDTINKGLKTTSVKTIGKKPLKGTVKTISDKKLGSDDGEHERSWVNPMAWVAFVMNMFSPSTEKSTNVFIRPSVLITSSNLILFLFIIILFIVLITYWAYTKSNWEQVKCKDGRFWIAPLFGKSTEETIKECTSKEIQLTVNKELSSDLNRIQKLEQNVEDLSANITAVSNDAIGLHTTTGSTLDDITNILESNITYVKEALSTILASIYISTNLNKGALTSYADLQKSDIAEIIDRYNNVDVQ